MALYRAAENGHEAVVRLLLEAKADVRRRITMRDGTGLRPVGAMLQMSADYQTSRLACI
jgi:hypothetical protein